MHEYCHVMIEPRFPRGGCNQWFEEAICEMSALFTLRRMSERWPTSPPYAHWSPYADSLAEYAHEKLEYIERTLPSSSEISEWFSGQEEALREHPYLRESNAVIARQLLPIFEAHPVAWKHGSPVTCWPAPLERQSYLRLSAIVALGCRSTR